MLRIVIFVKFLKSNYWFFFHNFTFDLSIHVFIWRFELPLIVKMSRRVCIILLPKWGISSNHHDSVFISVGCDAGFCSKSNTFTKIFIQLPALPMNYKRQAITWINADRDPRRHMSSLGHIAVTHLGRDKMNAISQTTFSNAFSWIKMFEFWLNFHWSLYPRVQLTMFQHWFR